MLETVLPLIHFMKQGKSSGSDFELGGIHSDFCFHCFVKYDRVTEKMALQEAQERSSLGRTIFFKTTLNCGHARIKNVISTILPELDFIVCYKKTVTLAYLCKQVIFQGPQFQLKLWAPKLNNAKNMSHLAEIYRLFPRRITAEVVFPNDVHPQMCSY